MKNCICVLTSAGWDVSKCELHRGQPKNPFVKLRNFYQQGPRHYAIIGDCPFRGVAKVTVIGIGREV